MIWWEPQYRRICKTVRDVFRYGTHMACTPAIDVCEADWTSTDSCFRLKSGELLDPDDMQFNPASSRAACDDRTAHPADLRHDLFDRLQPHWRLRFKPSLFDPTNLSEASTFIYHVDACYRVEYGYNVFIPAEQGVPRLAVSTHQWLDMRTISADFHPHAIHAAVAWHERTLHVAVPVLMHDDEHASQQRVLTFLTWSNTDVSGWRRFLFRIMHDMHGGSWAEWLKSVLNWCAENDLIIYAGMVCVGAWQRKALMDTVIDGLTKIIMLLMLLIWGNTPPPRVRASEASTAA